MEFANNQPLPPIPGQTLKEKQEFICEKPLESFQYLAQAHEFALANLEDLDPSNVDELLWFAAGVVGSRVEYGDLVVDENNQQSVGLAHKIMEKAVNLHRSGQKLPIDKYAIKRHEERKVIFSNTVDDFWNELAQLAEWREDMEPRTVSDLYERWRSRFIQRNKNERVSQLVAEYGIDPNVGLTPEGFHDISVTMARGSVVYETIDELLADMRTYFVPRMYNFEAGVVAKEAIETSAGVDPSYLSRLNPGGDDGIMRRLQQEITDWDQSGSPDYRDSKDYGSGDPYKYAGGLFTGYGIGISKTAEGEFKLKLVGRGYSYNESQPTQHIEAFAAFVGKDVSFDGDIGVTYNSQPPAEFAVSSRVDVDLDDEIADVVAISMPISNALAQLQGILGLSPDSVEAIWQNIERDPRGFERPPLSVKEDDITVAISYTNRLPQESKRSADGENIEGYENLFAGSMGVPYENRRFYLPSLSLSIAVENNPNRQSQISNLFYAIGAVARTQPKKSYGHGKLTGYRMFEPNEAI